ncbi:MAG: hypothetical protein ACOYMN_25840 [Roseimicrobium sp.]
MPATPDSHDAHDYAERIRDRFHAACMNSGNAVAREYGLARDSGLSGEYIGKLERGADGRGASLA